MIKQLILYDSSGSARENVILKVNKSKNPFTAEGILSVDSVVCEDINYEMEIISDEECNQVTVFLNGEELPCSIFANVIRFKNENGNPCVFSGIIGLVQFTLYVTDSTGQTATYYSEYASVLVRDTGKYQAVRKMLDYIFNNQADLLTCKTDSTISSDKSSASFDDFASQIKLLKDIIQVYKSLFGYFRMNSRSKLKPADVVDRVEKIQNIDSRTIQYIAQHPENLKRSLVGIHHGKKNYIPDKTLMVQNRISTDIYENQVVVAFLKKLLKDTQQIKNNLKSLIGHISYSDYSEEGYVISLKILYYNAEDLLRKYYKELDQLEYELNKIYSAYSEMFNVTSIDCPVQPMPTAIFISVPQYKEIFSYIVRWFAKAGYEFTKEQQMLTFMDIPSVYEAYVLAKLVNIVKNCGFELFESHNTCYVKHESRFIKNSGYNNTFCFRRNSQQITLYYEPVIFDDPYHPINGISLYRNNSISLGSTSEDERKGRYYRPDFLIKGSSGSTEKYAICDAKYKDLKTVRNIDVPKLQYKYLFSLSPTNANASIENMSLLYGRTFINESIESFFDAEGPIPIFPKVNMIPFAETDFSNELENSISKMIEKLV